MRDYWQKKPLLIRNALVDFPVLDADELAGYSLEDGVESRLIREKPKAQQPLHSSWRLDHGPFTESAFRKLPAQNWTLLVQAVNLLNPQLNELLHRFRFIPNWRLDDLMVSYAVDGGGVGPHFDYYDVFLLQASGTRHWRLGQTCDSTSPLRTDTACKILTEFTTTEEWTVNAGDLLYIPPQVAHWGIAQGECMTYSIGFRAPSYADLLLDFSQETAAAYSADQRFTDPERQATNDPGLIHDEDLTRVADKLREMLTDKERLADWFGRYMTQAQRDALAFEEEHEIPRLAPEIRAAYRPCGTNSAHLYLNGECFSASLALARWLCAYASIDVAAFDEADQGLIRHLLSEDFLR